MKNPRQMDHGDGSQHDNGQAGGHKPGEKPSEERQTAERLANDHEEGDDPRQPHFLGESSHGTVESEAAKPPQCFCAP